MKKKKKFIIISVFCIAILFTQMNSVVMFFSPKDIKIHKISFDDYNSDNKAFAYMNPFEYNEGSLNEKVKCTGWAFAETDDDNADKSTYLILKGKRNTFITEKCGQAIDDIHRLLPDWKKISGSNNNFAVEFSTLTLPDDNYEIFIYVEENENVKAITRSGQGFKKVGVKLFPYSLGIMCGEINPMEIANLIDYGWITVSTINKCIEVSGWGAVNSVISEESTYYVVYLGDNGKNVTINVANQYRVDVAEYLENSIYIGSGFTGRLDFENLPDTHGEAYLVIKNKGIFYKSDGYSYDINNVE